MAIQYDGTAVHAECGADFTDLIVRCVDHGLAGLELQLDKTLSGTPGSETIVRDPFGRAIDVVAERPERDGRDAFLTIDHTIQANAESVLRQTVSKWNATSATAVRATRRQIGNRPADRSGVAPPHEAGAAAARRGQSWRVPTPASHLPALRRS